MIEVCWIIWLTAGQNLCHLILVLVLRSASVETEKGFWYLLRIEQITNKTEYHASRGAIFCLQPAAALALSSLLIYILVICIIILLTREWTYCLTHLVKFSYVCWLQSCNRIQKRQTFENKKEIPIQYSIFFLFGQRRLLNSTNTPTASSKKMGGYFVGQNISPLFYRSIANISVLTIISSWKASLNGPTKQSVTRKKIHVRRKN